MPIETNKVTRVTDSDTAARPSTTRVRVRAQGKHMGNASLCVTCHSGLFARHTAPEFFPRRAYADQPASANIQCPPRTPSALRRN